MGKATDVGRAVLEAELELDAPKHVFLMLFLLIDRRNPDSFFKPYYDVLPRTLANMPIFWEPHELAWLEGSYLLVQIEERKRAIQADFEAIIGVWPALKEICTLDEFAWARMCVCSRNFGIVVNGTRTSAMVPYADMLNHLRPRETKWTFDNTRGAFTITALQTIQSGAQIFDSYGQKCNHRFLLNYGFAVEFNSEPDGFCPNEVALLVRLAPDDPLAARKQLLWIRDGALGSKRVRVCASDNENFRACLSLLRVAAANERELDHILGQNPYGSYRTASDVHVPVSLRNECAALSLLLHTCETMLDVYPCSLEDDMSTLSSNAAPRFSNKRHACIHVKSEKVVLHHYIHLSKTALDLAHQNDRDFDTAVSRLFACPTRRHAAGYCNGVVRQVRDTPQVAPSATALASINLSEPTIV
jgi:histone-lysine N-methyltransferase SETD3